MIDQLGRCAALTVVLFFAAFSEATSSERDYRAIVEAAKHPPDTYWQELVQEVVADLRLAERFQIRWEVSEQSEEPSHLSMILFDSDGVQELSSSKISGNCKYFSEFNTVTCDVAMIRLIGEWFGIDKKLEIVSHSGDGGIVQRHTYYSPGELRDFYRDMLRWVIGHEFGHAHNGHSGTFSILSAADLKETEKTLQALTPTSVMPVANRCHQMEEQADLFFATALETDDMAIAVYGSLIAIINSAKSMANCPSVLSGYSCRVEQDYYGTGLTLGPGIIQAKITATHPALILRVLNLLDHTWRDSEGGFHLQLKEYNLSVKLRNIAYSNDVCLSPQAQE